MDEALALYLRHHYGIVSVPTDEQIEAMIRGEGARVEEADPPGDRIKAVAIEDVIVLRRGLPHEWRRWLVVHELVHVVCGDTCRPFFGTVPAALAQDEERAERVTGYVFLGGHPSNVRSRDLALLADVPEECLARWRQLTDPARSAIERLRLTAQGAPTRAWLLALFGLTWVLIAIGVGLLLTQR